MLNFESIKKKDGDQIFSSQHSLDFLPVRSAGQEGTAKTNPIYLGYSKRKNQSSKTVGFHQFYYKQSISKPFTQQQVERVKQNSPSQQAIRKSRDSLPSRGLPLREPRFVAFAQKVFLQEPGFVAFSLTPIHSCKIPNIIYNYIQGNLIGSELDFYIKSIVYIKRNISTIIIILFILTQNISQEEQRFSQNLSHIYYYTNQTSFSFYHQQSRKYQTHVTLVIQDQLIQTLQTHNMSDKIYRYFFTVSSSLHYFLFPKPKTIPVTQLQNLNIKFCQKKVQSTKLTQQSKYQLHSFIILQASSCMNSNSNPSSVNVMQKLNGKPYSPKFKS
ncbi:unnamed protein product [Paramecium octaurelia]|uniref:Uncharacterized protein n=1 Tax=Paramecium octaurelia TaxID=43137 RepID=A0A8S1WJW3_PAROT|nr:unnamed protein product [Paramecium octaurelia]